jgi:hypothetical protein
MHANPRKTGKEQYYTNSDAVEICLDLVQKHFNLLDLKILEPSGGTGSFIEGLLKRGVQKENILSFDIEPKHDLVQQKDYLKTYLDNEFLTIGNPPFGRKNSLSKKFFNHSASHSSAICYLVPKSWKKWSVIDCLDKRFHLIDEIDMPKNCFHLPTGEVGEGGLLQTVFQIWQKKDVPRKLNTVVESGRIKKITKSSGFPDKVNFEITVFGWGCGKTKRITSTPEYNSTKIYLHVKDEQTMELLESLDYSRFYKNVSTVWSLSIQEINFLLNEKLILRN